MRYKIDINQIKKDMINPNQFNHKSSQRIRILPFTTGYKDEIYNWDAIVGEISRLSMGKETEEEIIAEKVFENILKLVDTKQKDVLIKFMKELYFKENGEIEPFHPSVFAYTSFSKQAKNEQKNIGRFIYDVLIRNQCEEEFKKLYLAEGDLVVSLLKQALPKFKLYIPGEADYIVHESKVVEVFKEDLKMLLQDEKLFIKWIKQFIEYYYFFYVSQTVLKLNQRLRAKEELIPLYFLVGSERGGRDRMSSKQGFKLLKAANENTFANVMLCQFLNYNEYSESVYTFSEWYKQYRETATDEEIEEYVKEIQSFIEFYKEELPNIPWQQLDLPANKALDPLEQVLDHAFAHIKFQFVKGGRKSAAQKYESWFYKFVSERYAKNGGSLGYLLHMDEEILLFLIGLTIGGQEKERLNVVFEQLECRGIFFDDYSKQYIVEMLEVRNLLEKKSDSGDAKYVRAIL